VDGDGIELGRLLIDLPQPPAVKIPGWITSAGDKSRLESIRGASPEFHDRAANAGIYVIDRNSVMTRLYTIRQYRRVVSPPFPLPILQEK
jgi:hypothetical protein